MVSGAVTAIRTRSCAGLFVMAWGLLGPQPARPALEEPATEDALVAALEAAKTDEERTELLEGNPRLLTPALRQALNARGEEFQKSEDYPRALVLHELAYRVAQRVGDRAGIAAALGGMGKAHHARGAFDSALRSHEESLALFEELGDKAQIAKALNEVGKALYERGDYSAALARLERSLVMSEAIESKAGVASAWLDIALVRYFQSDYPAALAAYQKSLPLSEELEDGRTLAACLNGIGMVYKRLGDFDLALQHYQRSLKLDEQLGLRNGMAAVLNNLGSVYYDKGDYARALESYQKSLDLKDALGDKGRMPNTLHNIGLIHEKQGNYELAEHYYWKALAISEEIGSKAKVAVSLLAVGDTATWQRKYDEARRFYGKALELYETLGNRRGVAAVLNAMGLVAQAQGDYALALERLNASSHLSEELGVRTGVAGALSDIASVERLQGKHVEALSASERAAAVATEIASPNLLWRALCEQGRAHRALGAGRQARRALEAAVETVDSLREDLAGGPQGSQRFLEERIVPYHELLALLLAEGLAREAFDYAERAKARTLLDVLRSGHVDITKAMTASERQQERALAQRRVTLGTAVHQGAAVAKPDAVRLADLKVQLENARLEYESFRTSLYASHPELRTVRGEVNPVTVDEAISVLPDDRGVLLEYVVTEDRTYLFVLTRGAEPLRVHSVEIRKKELTERVSAFRERLDRRDLDIQAPAAALHDLLLGPARAQIEGKTQLIIVPDDVLWDLPFQALRHAGNRYLLQDHAISYSPSITALREMAKHRKPAVGPSALLALGNPAVDSRTAERVHSLHRDATLGPLPHAEREVKDLARLYGRKQSRVYVGAEASERRTKAETSGARVLHFATHGIVNEASPMYSQLVLSQSDEGEDGLLEAWEILNLDLDADLAVLSACETGRGRVGAGEGMIGLSWAFFVAGCPTTVVSQWKVESASTTELMLAFHRNLKKGQSKAAALRSAALKLLGDSRYRHPFYWAGFVVVGDAS
jgi:CHAT domain-containing protein/Tfp pilus assembly protein PilF